MFKLIKILNSGVNVPEICKLEKPVSLYIKRGSALVINGGLASMCQETEVPTHIAIETTKEGAKSVFCHEVTSNMLFETPLNAYSESLNVGDKVTLSIDDDDCATAVTSNGTSGVATIVDLMGASYYGAKITVKF